MDTRDRLLTAVLGCSALDLDHLLSFWETYGLDLELGDFTHEFGPNTRPTAHYPTVMHITLEAVALAFLDAYGIPEDEPRDEHVNYLASGISFRDPGVQALFVAWSSGNGRQAGRAAPGRG